MKTTSTIGQKAQSMLTANPIVTGLIGLAAIIGIGIGIASRNKSKPGV